MSHQHTTTRWVAVIAAVIVAGCSSSTGLNAAQSASSSSAPSSATPAAQPVALGVEAPIGAVPWSQVGPGWMLATWSPVTGRRPGEEPPPGEPTYEMASMTLYLVDPAGGRYAIATFPPPGNTASPDLGDWSGDGSHALFYPAYSPPTPAVLVDLHTGAQNTLPVRGYPRFTRPDGKALLVANYPRNPQPATLERVDLAGKTQLTYPTDKLGSPFNGQYLETPDGTRLVLGTSAGIVVVGNDGKVGAALSIPGRTGCSPERWWDGKAATTILTSCEGPDSSSQLWLVPIDGRAPTALTAPNNHQSGPDLGDGLAWQLPAGTFVQASGGCGYQFLAKLNPDGTTTKVSVSDVDNSRSVIVVGVDGAALDLRATAACGGGQSLLRYDPAANTSTFLLGGPINGGGVIGAVAYPGQE